MSNPASSKIPESWRLQALQPHQNRQWHCNPIWPGCCFCSHHIPQHSTLCLKLSKCSSLSVKYYNWSFWFLSPQISRFSCFVGLIIFVRSGLRDLTLSGICSEITWMSESGLGLCECVCVFVCMCVGGGQSSQLAWTLHFFACRPNNLVAPTKLWQLG